MRGGDPHEDATGAATTQFSPHARGGSFVALCPCSRCLVFPACAGVILPVCSSATAGFSFPRMRGGDPQRDSMITIEYEFSPHARG